MKHMSILLYLQEAGLWREAKRNHARQALRPWIEGNLAGFVFLVVK
jgi:hypothetical protein